MNTMALNYHDHSIQGSILGKMIHTLFANDGKQVAVSTPITKEDIQAASIRNKQDMDAHIVISDKDIGKEEGMTVIHPGLLPSLVREMIGPNKEKLAIAAMNYWNFDKLDQSYQQVPEVELNVHGKYVCLSDMYMPGRSDTYLSMKDRLKQLCELYDMSSDISDPRLIPQIAHARLQLDDSVVSTFGNMFARSVNARSAIFETLRAIHFTQHNAVVYYDKVDVRKWFVKEQRQYEGCVPDAIVKAYKGKCLNKVVYPNGIVELTTEIPKNV